jgi:polygalacturonase
MEKLMHGLSVRLSVLACLAMGLSDCSPAVAPSPANQQTSDVQPALPDIPNHIFNLKDFGGVGDCKTWNTEPFRKAITAIDKQGGGRLVVPEGVYLTGQIELCSRLDLHLDAGAVIQAPRTFAEAGLPEPESFHNEADVRRDAKPVTLIEGKDLHDVAITGQGIIDGAGAHFWAWSERVARAHPGRISYPRPKLVVIRNCKRFHVDGITLRNSPQFHLVPYDTTDLVIEHVKISAPFDAPNTDAIDPSACVNVLIRDCDLDVGDDDVAIKGAGRVEHVLIEDCRIMHGHGISIGSETNGGVRDMLVRRCTFDHTENGIRIKSMRGAGGVVENIRYTDIQMKNVEWAIVMDLLYTDSNRPNFRGDPSMIPSIRDIRIDHVRIESAKTAGKIVGLPDSPISDVTLSDVQITADSDLLFQNTKQIFLNQVTVAIKNSPRPSTTQPTTKPS